jgi:LysR family glycine cleavage system transcriptional activator
VADWLEEAAPAQAAAELHVTPAAVSHQVKRLEDFLGTALFVRGHRSVRLTSAGEALARELGTLFLQLDHAIDKARRLPTTVIRVSTMESFAAKWLAPRLVSFHRTHPAIRLHLETRDERVDFARHQVDVAIRYGAGRYAGVAVEHLVDAPAFPVCSPRLLRGKAPLPVGRLKHMALLHDETSRGRASVPDWSTWIRANRLEGVDVGKGPVFASLYLAQEAAIAGHGVALGLAPLVQADLRDGRLARPFPGALENAYAFWLVRRKGERRPAVLSFCKWLKEEVDRSDGAVRG